MLIDSSGQLLHLCTLCILVKCVAAASKLPPRRLHLLQPNHSAAPQGEPRPAQPRPPDYQWPPGLRRGAPLRRRPLRLDRRAHLQVPKGAPVDHSSSSSSFRTQIEMLARISGCVLSSWTWRFAFLLCFSFLSDRIKSYLLPLLYLSSPRLLPLSPATRSQDLSRIAVGQVRKWLQ